MLQIGAGALSDFGHGHTWRHEERATDMYTDFSRFVALFGIELVAKTHRRNACFAVKQCGGPKYNLCDTRVKLEQLNGIVRTIDGALGGCCGFLSHGQSVADAMKQLLLYRT